MKKIFKLLAVLSFASFSFVSCDLTLMPEHETSPEKYFKTESDLMLWSNQFYKDILLGADYGSTTDVYLSNGISAYVSGNRTPQTQSWSFTALRNINYMLERLDQCEDVGVAKKYEAVGRFFRAYFYFKLVRTYGDVPYYDKVLGSTDPDVYKARDDRGYVMDRILEDYEFAIANLPGTWEAMNTRVTKWAAMGYASRAALFEGTFRKYHGMADADKYLAKAVEYSEAFIDQSPFSLYSSGNTPYRDLFVSANAITQEVVLARHYDTAYSVFHSMGYSTEFGRSSVTRRFVNHYLMADGTRFTDKGDWQTKTYLEETAGRDPRLAEYVIYNGATYKGTQIITGSYSSDNNGLNKISTSTRTGYYLRKLLRDDCDPNPSATNAQYHYPVYLRYTEIFLAYAEAANEAWGPTGKGSHGFSAYDVIKALHDRAGVGNDYLDSIQGDKDKMRQLIRNERRIELSFENKRFWDMRRWNLDLNETAKGIRIDQVGGALQYTKIDVEPRNYASHMYHGPIPETEVLKWSNLEQNKGW